MADEPGDRSTVILVNPRMSSPRSARLPLSLLALGAALEGRFDVEIVDGNLDPRAIDTVLGWCETRTGVSAVGVSVMPGPQVAPAIAVSAAVRAAHPAVPIIWGGFFPTLYPEAAIRAPYVDLIVRGQGEDTLLEVLDRPPDSVEDVLGLTWKRGREIVHNPARPISPPDAFPPLPYEMLRDVSRYLRPSFLGSRTAVHQAAVGCRFRCTFCGVASMFDGATELQGPDRLVDALDTLQRRFGADSVQFYDHNFFDRQDSSVEALRVLAGFDMPWWCYARTDTLANFSTATWDLIRRSGLKMAYFGAEAASDEVLRGMRKGARVEHTMEVAARCRENGVIPEFSFVLGGPEDPEEEIDRTFVFVKRLKEIHPECEIILYFYSPTPQLDRAGRPASASGGHIPTLERYGPGGPPLPTTPEGWADPRWVDYVCHRDAPWLTPRMRRKVRGFSRVLGCRFPTVQDMSTPEWGKRVLRGLASWRYASGRWERPWELELARRIIRLREPQRESI